MQYSVPFIAEIDMSSSGFSGSSYERHKGVIPTYIPCRCHLVQCVYSSFTQRLLISTGSLISSKSTVMSSPRRL